jgi:hypothetical protein
MGELKWGRGMEEGAENLTRDQEERGGVGIWASWRRVETWRRERSNLHPASLPGHSHQMA